MYQVIDHSGQTFGPAPIETLKAWAVERRLTPDMIVVDQATGKQGVAADMLLGMGVFLDPIPAPSEPAIQVPQISYSYKGSTEPGKPPMLQTRGVAFLIDFILGMSFYAAMHNVLVMLFDQFNTTSWSFINYTDYLIVPIVGIYFLARDFFFPGQSVGKRIAKLKVVSTNGRPLSVTQSALRNITAAPIVLLAIPYVAYVAMPVVLLCVIGDGFMVMLQGKRIGDTLAFTSVVNE